MNVQGRAFMRPVIEKELLHYDILFVLDKERMLENLTFQGGTSLRLCYGASRFSEDLDFAGGFDFEKKQLIDMKTCLEDYFSKHYNLEVSVKEPKDFLNEINKRNVEVSIWQIRIVTHPERKDIPKQMIKIEVANIPAYTREPRQISQNYDFLPDGYSDTILMVESLDEILSDKIIAFVSSNYIRYRDIWDFSWLKQKNAKFNLELVRCKIQDYKVDNFLNKLRKRTSMLPDIIYGKTFFDEMSRFLPIDIQEKTLLNKNFLTVLERNTQELLESCQ